MERFQFAEVHMGVRVDITLYARDLEAAEAAARAGFSRFAQLEAIMSDYRPDSELMKLCARAGQGPVEVSPDLFRVLEASQELAKRSEGAFDVTCGPLVQLWREARKTGRLPEGSKLAEATRLVSWRKLRLSDSRSVELEQPGMRLDLGGIAKGYACDEAIEAIAALGIERAMVESGGDIVVMGTPPGKIGWQIQIKDSEPVWLKDAAISTSGDAFQHVVVEGKRYSHILDPRTGVGLTSRLQATVIARRGIDTDCLATACCVVGREEGAKLAQAYGAKVVYVP